VFGHVVIAKQSTPEIKEAYMFIEKPTPEKRQLEKAKSDETNINKIRRIFRAKNSTACLPSEGK
jgi:hypothetical protein